MLSIVTTLYKSEPTINSFYVSASAVAKSIFENNYEIIFVNDGSPDHSLSIAVNISEKDMHVSVVDLSRNFGHYNAMMAGLEFAQGDLIFLIDSDMEENPNWLKEFYQTLKNSSWDVVYGVQKKRKGKLIERLMGRFFYRLINYLSEENMPVNIVTSRLMTRKYLDALLLHKECQLYMAGIWYITGFEQVPMSVKKESASKSTYTIHKQFNILFDAITSFSIKPLKLIASLGFGISLISFIIICYLFLQKIFFFKPLDGWTSLMILITFMSGLIILFLGIIGIYIAKIYLESKKRPRSIIRNIYKGKG